MSGRCGSLQCRNTSESANVHKHTQGDGGRSERIQPKHYTWNNEQKYMSPGSLDPGHDNYSFRQKPVFSTNNIENIF